LQTAIRNGDIADHLHLPVNYFANRKQVVRSKDWFIEHYDHHQARAQG
jgi:hypothetical protein